MSTDTELEEHIKDESTLSEELRQTVIRRDGYQCQRCGEPELHKLTVHHVIFRSAGGKHHLDNLVTLCGSHHMQIHKRTLYVKRINGAWYFRDNNLKKEYKHDRSKALAVVNLRFRRHSRWHFT